MRLACGVWLAAALQDSDDARNPDLGIGQNDACFDIKSKHCKQGNQSETTSDAAEV